MADANTNPVTQPVVENGTSINWNKVLGWIGGLIILFITIWIISRAWKKGQA